MRYLAVLLFISLSIAVAQRAAIAANRPVYLPGQLHLASVLSLQTTAPTLKQDFQELKRILPTKEMRHLILRYLLNDAEFQAVVRTINSYDAFLAAMRLRSQPEVVAFRAWVRMQIQLSGGSSSEEDISYEVHLLNKSPYWVSSVHGWQGFVSEFLSLYPENSIHQFAQLKVQQGGSFAEFWRRLSALHDTFERFVTFPETQRVIAQLQLQGVDVVQLESFIRRQMGWIVNPTTTPNHITPTASATTNVNALVA